ncbi:MAG: GNAT family N-acetyltransferase [Chloroflexi bacterium]|nr:GNAT family N-acetyltransferase [Chloroflexota bacterium]
MTLTLRPAHRDDAHPLGRICYEAFEVIGRAHNFPGSFRHAAAAADLLLTLIVHPRVYGVVAERDGVIVGSTFVDERSTVYGIGPVTVDPATQNDGVGRAMVQHVLDRAASQGAASVRLVQAAYHARALALYARLGFQVREGLAVMNGPALNLELPGRDVRIATEDDVPACNALCRTIHGIDRGGELLDAIREGTALAVETDGRVTGYASSLSFSGHAVGETADDIKALIGAVPFIPSPGILVPLRSPLFQWALARGLRVGVVMNLMSVGLYNEPSGSYLPSVLY